MERGTGEMKKATISRLIDEQKFDEAASMLKHHVREAEITDPRRDDSWGIDADILAYAILDHSGVAAFCSYWQEFLRFFVDELEPTWGHLHKGHIYLRLGTGYLSTDLEKAVKYLSDGLGDDRLVAEDRRKSDPGLDVEETVRDSPAYITLCTVRILGLWNYPSEAFRKDFFTDLVSIKFDVIWGPQEVDPRRVQRALGRIVTDHKEQVLTAMGELNRVFDQRLPLATMSTLESFLNTLLDLLRPKKPSSGDGFACISLLELLAAARAGKIFPDPAIQTVFQMAGILGGVFPFLQEANIPEKLTPRVLLQISVMTKILVDLALVRWSETL
jgi:hypothetical protein